MLCGDTMQRSLSLCPPLWKNLLDTDLSRSYDAPYSCVSGLEGSLWRVGGRHRSRFIIRLSNARCLGLPQGEGLGPGGGGRLGGTGGVHMRTVEVVVMDPISGDALAQIVRVDPGVSAVV